MISASVFRPLRCVENQVRAVLTDAGWHFLLFAFATSFPLCICSANSHFGEPISCKPASFNTLVVGLFIISRPLWCTDHRRRMEEDWSRAAVYRCTTKTATQTTMCPGKKTLTFFIVTSTWIFEYLRFLACGLDKVSLGYLKYNLTTAPLLHSQNWLNFFFKHGCYLVAIICLRNENFSDYACWWQLIVSGLLLLGAWLCTK